MGKSQAPSDALLIWDIDEVCSVKMAGYSPSSFICVFMERDEVEVHKLAKRNEANIQPLIMTEQAWSIERFPFECRKVIGFEFTTLRDWLKRFAPLFHPIRSKTKTNCDALACIFPRFDSATCNYFEF